AEPQRGGEPAIRGGVLRISLDCLVKYSNRLIPIEVVDVRGCLPPQRVGPLIRTRRRRRRRREECDGENDRCRAVAHTSILRRRCILRPLVPSAYNPPHTHETSCACL